MEKTKKHQLPVWLVVAKMVIRLAVTIYVIVRIVSFYAEFTSVRTEWSENRTRIVQERNTGR